LEITFDELSFREELIGMTYTEFKSAPKTEYDHGLIVMDLHTALIEQGLKVGNDLARDLFTVNRKGKIRDVFQVVTDTSTATLNSGTAQLLLSNIDLPERPRLVLTVPDNLDEALESKLKKLGIEILVYDWHRDQAVFPELANIVPIR
jgi:hypothetical protein